ncbi:MAG: hypothetical protein JWM73_1813, partial [Solirubrobacterales bacterium]|nr:hypothetical protein [Solirubrobacterales bacterium]
MGMSPRKELIAAGILAVLGLLAGALGLALDDAIVTDIAMPAALALCGTTAAIGIARSSRAEAAKHAATRLDALTGLPNGSQLRDDITAFLAARLGD